MGILDLEHRRSNLQDAIWRLEKQLRMGDRPDLAERRQELVETKRRELAEIIKMIADYERAYGRRTAGTRESTKA